ncbi:DNA-binding GntR family transcriptional regulator [Desulfobotulus alkaliphilus]|uniref:DNA-binding GntR family transcriptional regulator n=1 Tax=Desulfobotulus alkaliphilus TaxID=622671 RepID=A0A562S9W9_9BACT|nr:GntR family transcriptional regulator [Desulfobotulus alkaliphilus]TWI77306.1 DNA-binding GntR family transcriptional regulator [Desulfobotulus alkaliphilus]
MHKTLAEQARAGLEKLIVFNILETRKMYSEKQLAMRLGLGRTPVREALQRLSHDRMVMIHPRRGIQIVKLSVDEQLRLLEVRRAIEGACVHHAAMRATEEQKIRMRMLANAIMEAAMEDDDAEVLVCLREIHDVLVEATQNLFFAQAMSPLLSRSRRFWFMNKGTSDSHRGAGLYRKILDGVSCGDSDRAVQASMELMDYLKAFAESRQESGIA